MEFIHVTYVHVHVHHGTTEPLIKWSMYSNGLCTQWSIYTNGLCNVVVYVMSGLCNVVVYVM